MKAIEKRQRENLTAAVHEAGHAVLIDRAGMEIDHALLVPVTKERTAHGHVELVPDQTCLAETELECTVAGYVAVEIFRPRAFNWPDGDLKRVNELMEELSYEHKNLLLHEEYVRQTLREYWPLVMRLAEALVEKQRLTGEEVRTILNATEHTNTN